VYKYYNFNAERQIIGEITGNQRFGWKKFEVDLLTENSNKNNVSKRIDNALLFTATVFTVLMYITNIAK